MARSLPTAGPDLPTGSDNLKMSQFKCAAIADLMNRPTSRHPKRRRAHSLSGYHFGSGNDFEATVSACGSLTQTDCPKYTSSGFRAKFSDTARTVSISYL